MSKIELQTEITHNRLKHFNFPRIGKPSKSFYPRLDRNGVDRTQMSIGLPSQEEIIREIELAKLQAIEYTETLGMRVQNSRDYKYEIRTKSTKKRTQLTDLSQQFNYRGIRDEDVLQLFPDVNFKPYAKKVDHHSDTSSCVKVKQADGTILHIEKHTLCWLLSKTTTKLSSDRLVRVMSKQPKKS